jgi:polyhydroxyalkanoate synthesis repressor PhaR
MPIIKRYPNRKLYDTEAKQYITLDGIAVLIRQGQEVVVIDHGTGEDLTAITLSQVIFEQAKRRRGFLPQSVLTGLIQAGGETVGTLRRTLAHPLDLARQVDEEIEQRVQVLISRGELAAEDGRRLRDKLLAPNQAHSDPRWPSEQELERVLADKGIPSRDELRHVLDQLEALSAKLDSMVSQRE